MNATRIPDFVDKSKEGMSTWFAEMADRGLVFHPEDAPASILCIETGDVTFTQDECVKLDSILADMFEKFGDGVCEVAYPVFMKRMRLYRSARW